MSKSHIIDYISKIIRKIQSDEKVGSAIERYNTEHLWELGNLILQYHPIAADKEDITGEIMRHLHDSSIRCGSLLLRNAETARRTWSSSEEYQGIAEGVSYGKLKAVLPLFDPDFILEADVKKEDLEGLMRSLRDLTYEQVLDEVRRFRAKHDSTGASMDFDELYSDLYEATETLANIVNQKDFDTMRSIRSKYAPDFLVEIRRLIAAMKNEKVFQEQDKILPKRIGKGMNESTSDFDGELSRIVHKLSLVRQATPELRDRLRKRVGISRLGEFSTLLKAISTDEELRRYLRGKRIFEQIRLGHINIKQEPA